MIRYATDGQRLHVILPRDAAEVRPEPFTDSGREPRTPLFGGEYAMHQAGVERVHDDGKNNDAVRKINIRMMSSKIVQPFMAGNKGSKFPVPLGTTDGFFRP